MLLVNTQSNLILSMRQNVSRLEKWVLDNEGTVNKVKVVQLTGEQLAISSSIYST